jgi:hypothetical protein
MPFYNSKYDNLRESVHPALAELSDSQLEYVLRGAGVDADSMEGFLGDIGKFALSAAPSILPAAGGIVGGMFGGPVGASLGSSLGSLAGKAVGSLGGPAGAPAAAGGSPAAGQLLQTITKPETMQAIASMAMGALGKSDVSVRGTSVPVGAFANLLGTLIGKAQAEYAEALAAAEGDGTPAYMKDFAGQPVADPSVPLNRAIALYQLLQTTGKADEQESLDADADAAEADALQAEYDEMELTEVYESEEA